MRQLWIVISLLLLGVVNLAQTSSQEVVIMTPVSGRLVFSGSTTPNSPVDAPELVLVDTLQGSWKTIVRTERNALSPRFDLTGEKIAYSGDSGLIEYFITSETQNQANEVLRHWPFDFSPDGQSILAVERLLPPNHEVETLGMVDVASGAFRPLFSFSSNQPITSLPPSVTPQDPSVIYSQLRTARWNPSFADWILIQISTGSALGVGEEFQTPLITFLYNLQSNETISLDKLFPRGVSVSEINWNEDGRLLNVSTFLPGVRTQTAIISFNPSNVAAPVQVVSQASTLGHVELDWLGAGNLLLMIQPTTGETDFVLVIAEIIENQLYTTEFLRLPRDVFPRVRDLDWHITASEEEKRQLTCLFDQTLPAQLELNSLGRVTLGGTASRLRDDHSTRASIITQMVPGTAFTVVGLPHCEGGYRWWQIQLGSGLIGWAAESSRSEYFLEPMPVTPPTPTPMVLERVRLTAMCSDDPASVRVWRVRNPNGVAVLITWEVVGTAQRGALVVPANGEAFFETVAVSGPNTTSIFREGVQQDVKASGGARCG